MAQKGEVGTSRFCSLRDFVARCFEQSGRGREKRAVQECQTPSFVVSFGVRWVKKCVCVGEILKQEQSSTTFKWHTYLVIGTIKCQVSAEF